MSLVRSYKSEINGALDDRIFSNCSGSLALNGSVDKAPDSWRGSMTVLRKTVTATAIVALVAGTMTTTPASAWYSGYNNGAEVAGAIIGGMALGAAVGAMASQPHYGYGGGYGYTPAYGSGYGYGYAPYRVAPAYGYGGGNGPGYGYLHHHHVGYYDYD
jgi:hypothetical protein